MSTKFVAWTIRLLLFCGLPLLAQQPGPPSQRILAQCWGQRGLTPRRNASPCKPVLSGLQAQQLSVDLPHHDDGATYMTFDVTGDVNGIFPYSINDAGAVTGYYTDAGSNYHGFLRDLRGNITNIDIPGADNGTYPAAINAWGTITGGWCADNYTVCPGFVRDRDGSVVSFDFPGDVYGTNPTAIDDEGTVTGYYWDANFNGHGFLRTRDGRVTQFDVPGAQSTNPYSINPARTVAGAYTDANGSHAFIRSRDGSITTFDVPGGMNTGQGGYYGGQTVSINPEGEVAGSYFQPIPGNPFGGNYQGFLRHRDGSFDTFYAADYPPCCIWNFSAGITPDQTITGFENDGYSVNHGFVRTRDGNIALFDAPGAGTTHLQGTVPLAINAGRVITGFYTDSNGTGHGFLRIPH